MNIFLGRQPIFDINGNVVAYEILFRNSNNNFYIEQDGNNATIDVIVNTFYSLGVNNVTGGKRAFINFTKELIQRELATVLPPDILTVEILENIEPTEEVVLACKSLKNKGYTIALDDFVFEDKYIKLIELADIIKIDFTLTKGTDRKKVIDRINNHNIKYLAEKVETLEEYEEAKRYGYTYFQGYFLSKPKILKGRDIPKNEVVILKIMEHLKEENIDYEYLTNLIMKDVSTSYKLIKYINSSYFSIKNKVKSIKQAIAFLGKDELKKWLYIVMLGNISQGEPNELTNTSLVRAKFCENILIYCEESTNKVSDGYIMGLVSLMDCMLHVPMREITNELGLSDEVAKALNGEESYLNNILRIVIAYEREDWSNVVKYSKIQGLKFESIAEAYIDAVIWSNNV